MSGTLTKPCLLGGGSGSISFIKECNARILPIASAWVRSLEFKTTGMEIACLSALLRSRPRPRCTTTLQAEHGAVYKSHAVLVNA